MTHGDRQARSILSPWPVPRPRNWAEIVQEPQTEAELTAIRRSVLRGVPFGDETWTDRTIQSLHLETTLRPRGRPKKGS